jgi:hypothetical protein
VNTVQKVAVIIAGTGLLTTLVLPGRQTPQVIGAIFNGLGNWTRKSQGFK